MLVVDCQDELAKAREFADKIGLREQLEQRLQFLENYGGDPDAVKCHLYKDFAPYSFAFTINRRTDNIFEYWFNGGLIFHGEHDNHGSGSAPTFAVCVSPTTGWSIHT